MRVDVVTIFPEYLAPLELSLIGRARRAGILDVAVHDLRTFAHDRHRTVDDAPLGGGAGMVMRPEPWGEALDHVLEAGRASIGDTDAVPTLLVPSPAGEPFTQAVAQELAGAPWLAFACGRYEGIDERVLDEAARVLPVRSLSLGDYVLNGGEVAVLAVVEAVARLLPGVLGNADSLTEESHENGLLEYPVYTRPASWRGREVPPVLLSGHHAQIRRWRRDEQLRRTAARRPDLIAALDPAALDAADLAVLAACGWTVGDQGRLVSGVAAVADWTTVPPAGHALPQGGEAPAPEPPDRGGRHSSDGASPELRG
jgi:tRNA (guanine37-N1)-methyltransferase